jgi:hypothetical protein
MTKSVARKIHHQVVAILSMIKRRTTRKREEEGRLKMTSITLLPMRKYKNGNICSKIQKPYLKKKRKF